MASRNFNNECLHLEREVVKLYVKLTIGASGAVTLTRGKGVASAALTATGRYTLTLDDKYSRLLYANGNVMRTTGTCDEQIKLNAETVASTKTVEIGVTKTSDGTVLEPTSGDIIFVELTLQNAA